MRRSCEYLVMTPSAGTRARFLGSVGLFDNIVASVGPELGGQGFDGAQVRARPGATTHLGLPALSMCNSEQP